MDENGEMTETELLLALELKKAMAKLKQVAADARQEKVRLKKLLTQLDAEGEIDLETIRTHSESGMWSADPPDL